MWRWHVYGHTWCERGDQSPHHFTSLVKWEYALINPRCCGGQSPLSAIANNLTTSKQQHKTLSLCPQKDALSTETKVRKDTHASVKTLSLCFAFNGVLGLINTMNSAIRYSQKSERWKSKSTKVWNCELEKSVIVTTIRITSTITSTVTLMFTRTFVKEAQPLNR